MNHISISDRKNLLIKVFVFGYPTKGESILVLFIDKQYGNKNKVLFSMVIDSFKFRGINKTVDIMSSIGLMDQKIDMLIWSHPDYDHTYGIDTILKKFCDDGTKVVLPYDLNGEAWNKISYNKDDKKIVGGILALTKANWLSHETVSVFEQSSQEMAFLNFYDYIGELPVKITALTPHGSRINYLLEQHATMHKNDLSISIMIEVGKGYKYKLLFMADTENCDIRMIDYDRIKDPVFIKIPHHTSSSSDLLFKLLKEADDRPYVSCTTVYKNHKLPEKGLLRKYNRISHQTDCTGFAKGKNSLFGYIEYTFDFYDLKRIVVSHKGHATVVDKVFLRKTKRERPLKRNSRRFKHSKNSRWYSFAKYNSVVRNYKRL